MPPKSNKPTLSNKPILCGRCKRLFYPCAVATCPHPAVNQHFGKHICMYCCMKCEHHKKITNPGGVTCVYGGDL